MRRATAALSTRVSCLRRSPSEPHESRSEREERLFGKRVEVASPWAASPVDAPLRISTSDFTHDVETGSLDSIHISDLTQNFESVYAQVLLQ